MVKAWWLICVAALLLLAAGCGGPAELMPTPNIYTRGESNPFADVPAALRSNHTDVLYLTDRQREGDPAEKQAKYGYERSRAVSFGVSSVEFGEGVSWDEIVAASRTHERKVKLPLHVTKTTEYGRFPPTPKTLIEDPEQEEDEADRAQREETLGKVNALLSKQLALTPVKDVYIYIHGYSSTFEESVEDVAELWHFFGRQGVPVAYTWPAGHSGLLKGYNYDRESSEFTVSHLRVAIKQIAKNPDVRKIHIIAHSRGTDVAMSALRELLLENGSSPKKTREALKLGTVVLAAPDLDFDVIVQRAFAVKLQYAPERTVIYVCAGDDALGLSNWLFGGTMRLGKLRSDVFSPRELEVMRKKTSLEIIDVHVSEQGNLGHNYYEASPAVSSDLVLLMRYHLAAGEENGRPLKVEDDEFWMIDDSYPKGTLRAGK